MEGVYNILLIFDWKIILDTCPEISPEFGLQMISIVTWLGVIQIFVGTILMFSHMMLYYCSTWYYERQLKGIAIFNTLLKLKRESEWDTAIRAHVEQEYNKIKHTPSIWNFIIPQICSGGWKIKNE